MISVNDTDCVAYIYMYNQCNLYSLCSTDMPVINVNDTVCVAQTCL